MTAAPPATPVRVPPFTPTPAPRGSFWSEPLDALCARLRCSPRGLTTAEAAFRLRELGPASVRGTTSSSTGRILLRYSGTESLARVMIEGADDTRIRAMADELAADIRRELGT